MTHDHCSPLELDGERMTSESFLNLWHTPGFKYEYGHGRANISVQRSATPTVVAKPRMIGESLSEAPCSDLPEDLDLKSARSPSKEELSDLWMNAFIRTPDYYGYSVEDVQREASETLDTLYQGESPSLHPASVIARWRENLVGMLLVNQDRPKPLIEALAVRPDVQYRGVGKAMVRAVANGLHEEGEDVLCSRYLLANARSAAWHEATGFIEIPDWLITNHRLRCAQHNLKMGLVRDVGGMKRYVEMLRTERENMRKDRDEDPDAHCPFQWIKSDGDRIEDYLSEDMEQIKKQGTGSPRTFRP